MGETYHCLGIPILYYLLGTGEETEGKRGHFKMANHFVDDTENLAEVERCCGKMPPRQAHDCHRSQNAKSKFESSHEAVENLLRDNELLARDALIPQAQTAYADFLGKARKRARTKKQFDEAEGIQRFGKLRIFAEDKSANDDKLFDEGRQKEDEILLESPKTADTSHGRVVHASTKFKHHYLAYYADIQPHPRSPDEVAQNTGFRYLAESDGRP